MSTADQVVDNYERGEVTSNGIADALFEQVQNDALRRAVHDAALKRVWEAASQKRRSLAGKPVFVFKAIR